MLPKLPLAMEDISLMLWESVAAETSVPEGETAEVTREIIEFATVEQFCENRSTVYILEVYEYTLYSYEYTVL